MSSTKIKPTGKQIRKALIDLGMNQVDVARAVGVSDIYIRMITTERRKAIKMRQKIAHLLAGEYVMRGLELPFWVVEYNQQKGV